MDEDEGIDTVSLQSPIMTNLNLGHVLRDSFVTNLCVSRLLGIDLDVSSVFLFIQKKKGPLTHSTTAGSLFATD